MITDLIIVFALPTILLVISLIFSGKLGKIGISKKMIVGFWIVFFGYSMYVNPIVKPMNSIERTEVPTFDEKNSEVLDLQKKPKYNTENSQRIDAATKAEEILKP